MIAASLSAHRTGRVTGLPGVYCSGWIKRGATGIIATTMADAFQTASAILDDIRAGVLDSSIPRDGLDAVRPAISSRVGVHFILFLSAFPASHLSSLPLVLNIQGGLVCGLEKARSSRETGCKLMLSLVPINGACVCVCILLRVRRWPFGSNAEGCGDRQAGREAGLGGAHAGDSWVGCGENRASLIYRICPRPGRRITFIYFHFIIMRMVLSFGR
jgi:hypothetical protein